MKLVIAFKKEFDSEPLHNEKYLKTKIKSDEGKANTDIYDYGMPKEGTHYICLLVILVDSVFKIGKNYYPQVFLEEHKYIIKRKKVSRVIDDDLEISSFDSDDGNSNKAL